MSNSNYTSNYTKVYNCFYKLIPCLKESELKIMLIINRQTDGWGKKSDRISYSQFQKATGLSRRAVGVAIQSLKENRFITVRDYRYSINWERIEYLERSEFITSQNFRLPDKTSKVLNIK